MLHHFRINILLSIQEENIQLRSVYTHQNVWIIRPFYWGIAWKQEVILLSMYIVTKNWKSFQFETYLSILPIMLHHFRINILLSIIIKHKSENRGYSRIRGAYLSRTSCTYSSAGQFHLLCLSISANIMKYSTDVTTIDRPITLALTADNVSQKWKKSFNSLRDSYILGFNVL
jgi:hypothetical protein